MHPTAQRFAQAAQDSWRDDIRVTEFTREYAHR